MESTVCICFVSHQESHMCAVLVSEENENPVIVEDSKSGEKRKKRRNVSCVMLCHGVVSFLEVIFWESS